MKRVRAGLGKSKERFRLFEELTKERQALVRELLALDDGLEAVDLGALGLPPTNALRRWAGTEPATVLEKRVGKRPVWRWLEATAAGELDERALIKTLGKALDATEIADVCRQVCDLDRYDLFREGLDYERGESFANAFQLAVIKLLGALIDASGNDAALSFAEAAKKKLARDAAFWLAAIACFALVAHARRRDEEFPNQFAKLAADADFLGNGANLVEGYREIAEVMSLAQREKLIMGDGGPFFNAGYNDDIKNGKRVEVPTLSSEWLIADLAPTDRVVKAMVASIFNWDNDRKPTQLVLDIFAKVGAVAIPHLKAALRKQTPYKKVLTEALARIEVQTGAGSRPRIKPRR